MYVFTGQELNERDDPENVSLDRTNYKTLQVGLVASDHHVQVLLFMHGLVINDKASECMKCGVYFESSVHAHFFSFMCSNFIASGEVHAKKQMGK